MNFKTKAFGLLAGTALAISLTTGVMAQSTTNADLFDKVAGNCSVSASSGSIDLGEWEWNGSAYVLRPGTTNGSVLFNITQNIRPSNADCTVSVVVSDLIFETVNVIPSANITLSGPGPVSGPSHVVSTATGAGSGLTLTATLGSVPSGLPQGTYTGTVTATANRSSN